eukprot:TRINITY_DN12934_c0_g1_i1.p1 TRINITY_DN12934_c0_g1~~TRINITY_DN12934_c0_g1_i1.p1  ORF type:complete len:401 (-),score=119.99 TRINITY_DN12934_c0_g1_i1:8-1210(-)
MNEFNGFLGSFDVKYTADSIESCPYVEEFENIFVCGCYQLDEETRRRIGGIHLFELNIEKENENNSIDENNENESSGENNESSCFDRIQFIETQSGILDTSWCDKDLVTAESTGKVSLYEIENGSSDGNDNNKPQLRLKGKCSIEENSKLGISLAVDWNCYSHEENVNRNVVSSYTNGEIAIFDVNRFSLNEIEDEDDIILKWKGHHYEPWACCYNKLNHNLIFSGGDDLKLKCWDIRLDCQFPTFVNAQYDMGVTCIQCSPFDENIFAVGSYDQSLQLYDIRNPKKSLSSIDLGGGIWRIKWHPTNKKQILTACMRGNYNLVSIGDCSVEQQQQNNNNGDNDDIDYSNLYNLGFYDSVHNSKESLAYGVDWIRNKENTFDHIASCSFYNHICSVWNITE